LKERSSVFEECDCGPQPHGFWSFWEDLPAVAVHDPMLPFFMSHRYKIVLPQKRKCLKCGRGQVRQVFVVHLSEEKVKQYLKDLNLHLNLGGEDNGQD
jgi:hypothetical protein